MSQEFTQTDRYKAMTYSKPEYIPIAAGILPAAWIRHREKLEEIVLRHPLCFGEQEKGSRDFDDVSGLYVQGNQVDAWGCEWSNIIEGCDSYVTQHPLPRRDMVRDFQPPAPGAGLPHGFMYMRLFYLRGFEELMMDFADEPPELRRLIDIVVEYNAGEIQRMMQNPPQIASFGDDLGMQTSLPISPESWRKHLKPCFKRLYDICHQGGSYVYMHTDGHIVPIIRDLIDCGVNVINPQIRANGLDHLVRECKGKVCVNLDLDRQLFPFARPADLDPHVKEAVEKLGSPEGGLWLSAEIGQDVPLDNVEAICQALEKYRAYFT